MNQSFKHFLKADHLEVKSSGNSIACCLSTSPTSSKSSSLKKKSPSLKSHSRPILTRSEVSNLYITFNVRYRKISEYLKL